VAVKSFAQNSGIQLGSSLNQLRQAPQGGFYDFSDPQSVNIKVAVWGWVRYPGKYVIPSYSSINDLISYAGGPTDAARMENMRLMRLNKDSSQTLIDLKYSDLMIDIQSKSVEKAPALQPGDVLLVIGEPRYYFRDYLSMGLSALSVIVSVATLIVVYARK
jgi:hypothetical protein